MLNYYLKLLIPFFFNFLIAGVDMEIQNVDTLAGTLDIYMSNMPSCSYCEDPDYNNNYNDWQQAKASCEIWSSLTWILDTELSESECAAIPSITGNGGWWFDGNVAGFQFELLGITILDISGGNSPEHFDFIDFNPDTGTIMAVNISGGAMPPGSGTLIQVSFSDYAGDMICFGDNEMSNVISDTNANMVETEWGYCYGDDNIYGCTDELACNYNPEATADDGSCNYTEENFDCDGNCVVEFDCLDVCGGNAVEDECGVCDGSGPEEYYNCDGECINDADVDGICDELEPPEIAVTPNSLSSNLLSGETDTQILTISNEGDGVLEWTLNFSNEYNVASGAQDNEDIIYHSTSNNVDFSPLINSGRSNYEIGDQISIEDQSIGYEVCYGDYPSESISLADFNGETNGGNFNVLLIEMSATW